MNKVLLGTVTIGSLVAGCCGETSKVKKLFCECFSIKEDDVYAVTPFTTSLDLSNPQVFNNINQSETAKTLLENFSKEQVDKIRDKHKVEKLDMTFYFDLEKKKCFAIFYNPSNFKTNRNKVKILPTDDDVSGLKKYQPNDKIFVDPYPDHHNEGVIKYVNIYKLL